MAPTKRESVKVVLQDFDLSMQTPTWDAVVRHLRPRALQPSTSTASSGSMQIDSEASSSAPAARPLSRKRPLEEDEEQLSEELQRYQTTYVASPRRPFERAYPQGC